MYIHKKNYFFSLTVYTYNVFFITVLQVHWKGSVFGCRSKIQLVWFCFMMYFGQAWLQFWNLLHFPRYVFQLELPAITQAMWFYQILILPEAKNNNNNKTTKPQTTSKSLLMSHPLTSCRPKQVTAKPEIKRWERALCLPWNHGKCPNV